MGTLRPNAEIRYFKEDKIVYGEYADGERFIVGGDSLSLSKQQNIHITQAEFDYIKELANKNASVEALLRKFSKEIRGYY